MDIIREDCIYARQSVDRKDSISIESQIDFCKYELKGGSCKVFKDKGYSGKNTDRPEFQKLLGEIRKGKVLSCTTCPPLQTIRFGANCLTLVSSFVLSIIS